MSVKSVKREEIVKYLDRYLKVGDFQDYCVNGLQIEGRENVSRIVTGVSLSERLLKRAVDRAADMLIVHHGIFSSDVPSPLKLSGLMKERIKILLCNDISLVGYHLPLDAHPRVGNNISLAKILNVKKCKALDVGFVGELEKAIDFKEFVKLVDSRLGVKSFVLPYGKSKVKKVGIISGGSSSMFELVKDAGAEVFISGDIKESVVRKIEEAGINFINAGHYNTEKLGIQNLGRLIERKFRVRVEFIDIPTDV